MFEIVFMPDKNGNCTEITNLLEEEDFRFSEQLDLTDAQENWINDLKNKQVKDATTKYLSSFILTAEFDKAKEFANTVIESLFTNSWMTINDIDFDNKIIKGEDILDNTNNPCVSDIIKTLQEKDMRGALVPNLVGKSHLSQIDLDLFGECTNYDLIIDIKELGNNIEGYPINAQTKGFESITLDDDLVREATQLSIAKTLIHESLHVYINLKTNKYNTNKDFYYAVKAYYDKFKTSNLSQHNFMADFVEALAYSLSAYDFNKEDISYYKAMSWGGLESSDAYKKLSNKDEIQKIIKNERYAKKGAKSTKCDK